MAGPSRALYLIDTQIEEDTRLGERPDHPSVIGRSSELAYISRAWETIQHEEFPEGPYGSRLFPQDKPGKVTPWEEGQQVVTRFKDENPAFSAGQMPPPGDQPQGSQL